MPLLQSFAARYQRFDTVQQSFAIPRQSFATPPIRKKKSKRPVTKAVFGEKRGRKTTVNAGGHL